ncbi:FAD binding domain-containing protein [Phreatobacter stygius]|uniref:FAD-binding molybdopterin dehydrogenase n=1 Tax=Phreatobacter stygius TaxID=1940610 RepID=A0A4D7B644_9HYPH|nr:FAD binding domain-containing protein [Phreatobacter stygius]QCI66453.1 FAD-binding molybdopterin dehydrogenase [Phreatobacter stygius]
MVCYHRPPTLAEALNIRAAHDVVVLAGGTDIYPVRTARRAWGDPTHKDVLDLTAIPGLRGITDEGSHWRFGCLTTWTDLIRADLPSLFDAYRQAAREVGGVQVQNLGTLTGNIVTASPAGDGIPNLLALDAQVELSSVAGSRSLALGQFIDGYRHTAMRADEIVTALTIPKLANARSCFKKLGARKYLVISIAMVSGVVAVDMAGGISEARIAVGACSAVAARLTALEATLAGVPLAAAASLVTPHHLDGLTPIDDVRATGAYRRAAALALVRDCLSDLAADSLRRAA